MGWIKRPVSRSSPISLFNLFCFFFNAKIFVAGFSSSKEYWSRVYRGFPPPRSLQLFPDSVEMKKGAHPQRQWISYVTQSGRLMNVMMTKIHNTGKVYHFRAKRQMAESLGQIAKFKRRYGQENEEETEKGKKDPSN
ncbi:unnamed protein product [Linum tenue]|uniref:Uncharacterized protein n=1 Tax=Linum tenue TaxID=586396 RepID=A0AAV0LS04_9ROSI|nr:unnamed protein product [Linum tenue]